MQLLSLGAGEKWEEYKQLIEKDKKMPTQISILHTEEKCVALLKLLTLKDTPLRREIVKLTFIDKYNVSNLLKLL